MCVEATTHTCKREEEIYITSYYGPCGGLYKRKMRNAMLMTGS
jgi:hypothetical protein